MVWWLGNYCYLCKNFIFRLDMSKFSKFFCRCAFGVLAIMLLSASAVAQNVQLHYDFGRDLYSSKESDRQKVTLTYETFKADNLGSWYLFADFDLRSGNASGAYTEISREFRLGKSSPFAAHIEFDGGLNLYGGFQNAVLVGPAYNGHSADFSKTWSVQLMYKQLFKSNGNKAIAGVQLTGVWGITFGEGKWTFSGFADVWTGYIPDWDVDGQKKGLVFLAEPQMWYNVSKSFSVGTEWELSNNFIYPTGGSDSFFINPTIAVKFNL